MTQRSEARFLSAAKNGNIVEGNDKPREDGQTIEEMRKDVMLLSSSEEKKRAAGHELD